MANVKKEKLFDTGLLNPNSSIYSRSCIGDNNGGMGNRDYTDGFEMATDLLLCIANNYHYILKNPSLEDEYENRIYCFEDPIIYPIIFTARHYIELSLKNRIEDLINLLEYFENITDNNLKNKFTHHCICQFRSADLIRFIGTHSILVLFNKLEEISSKLDREIVDFLKQNLEIRDFIQELEDNDPNGETFRYRTSSDYKEDNLEKLDGLIDRENFFNQFEKIKVFLENLKSILDRKIADFSTGTWTSKLSRNDLNNIAKKLPNRENWRSSEFDETKKQILLDYQISSNDFSKALKIIENHREFMSLIGLELPIEQIDEQTSKKIQQYRTKQEHDFSQDELRTLYAVSRFDPLYDYSENFGRMRNSLNSYVDPDSVIGYIANHNIDKQLKELGQTTLLQWWQGLGLPQSSEAWKSLEAKRNEPKLSLEYLLNRKHK